MANAIDTRLKKLSSERNAAVKELRALKASKRDTSLSDAEVKSINDKIKEAEADFKRVDSERNRIFKMKESAKEYLELNKELKEFNARLSKAEARGEDTDFIQDKINSVNTRLGKISPDIEREFPEIKPKTPAKAEQAPKGTLALGPDGKPVTQPRTAPAPAPTPTPEPTVTPAATPTPTPTPATAGDITTKKDARPGADKKDKKTPPAKLTIDQIIDQVAQNYGAIDSIFRTDPDLQALLRKAIGKDGVPATDDDLNVDQFTRELENTTWFKTNAGPLRQRGFYKRQFDDLLKGGAVEDELLKTSEYGRGLFNTKQLIEDQAVALGVVLDPDDLDLMARDIYDLGNETKPAIIQQRIRSKIAYKPGATLSGKAGTNLAELRKVAAANGLDLDKNFGSSLQGWLQKLAQGESIETFKQIVRSSAKLGLPDKVASLLDQGVDLDTIYKPYKDIMASVLEVNPTTITINDSVLRSAIGPDKEMSLFDFQKMLRKDDRWQYTNQAKQEVSDIGLRVLRDFGFQG
jgi:hypothetical protein